MSPVAVDTNLCVKDGACVAVCPSRALALNSEGFPEQVPERRCILCGHCVAVCACEAMAHTGLPQEPFLPAPQDLPDPAAIDRFLSGRRSVREFSDRPIARERLEPLLEVARRAPTATNSQTLHWVVVNGRDKVHSLSAEAINWIRSSNTNPKMLDEWEKGYDFVLRGAPALIVVCAPSDYAWGKEGCAIALTFLELAAEARGLGVCWAGYLTRVTAVHAPLRKTLSIPDGFTLHGGLMIGEGRYSYRRIPPRKPVSVAWI